MSSAEVLPVEAIREQVLAALAAGPAVVCAPTGSGKSTQVPRWCRSRGRVLVVEPRRVACRSLAQRVAELERCRLGGRVGYSVRDDHRAEPGTEILFATTGIAIRLLAEGALAEFHTIVLDEFHERSLDLDLLLALLLVRQPAGLCVMSATLDGEAVSQHVGGTLLTAEGRQFPVEQRYLPGGTDLPDVRGLEERVGAALVAARDDPGDVLVFLPGKGEIAGVGDTLAARADLQVLPLHGGLSLDEQSRAFAPAPAGRRKVVLATNVAETSLTLPGVGVVIDSGLVRRTRYHKGRGYLSLLPIALDSAEQRAGRAGRTAPGVCYRLWRESVRLERGTPAEIHREALAPLVLAAAAAGAQAHELPFLDPPQDFALEAALEELQALGALDERGQLTERGGQIFRLPVDPALGRLLVEGEARGTLSDVVDLVGVLAVGRGLFRRPPRPEDDVEEDPRAVGCDATAAILALRGAPLRRGVCDRFVLEEGRRISSRLRQAFGLPRRPDPKTKINRVGLAQTAIGADPRCVYIARTRRGKIAWSNGGTEVELSSESAVLPSFERKVEALAALDSRAMGSGGRSTVRVTCATPLRLSWLVEAGLGTERARDPVLRDGVVLARIERVYAKRVLATREEAPTGALARAAVAQLFLEGRWFKSSREPAQERLEAWALLRQLRARQLPDLPPAAVFDSPLLQGEVPSLEEWLLARLEALGVESGEDLALLGEEDLLPEPLPAEVQAWLDRHYPRRLALPDGRYRVRYDLLQREAILEPLEARRRRTTPPASQLPSMAGFRVLLEDRGSTRLIRS